MNSTVTLDQFLIEITGLPRKRMLELYEAGCPWPLFTIHYIRKASILAQTKGLLFSDALAEVEAADDELLNEALVMLDSTEGTPGSEPRDEVRRALTSIPWIKEILDHLAHLAVRTGESPGVLVTLALGIQRYAAMHPGWELVMASSNSECS